MTIHELLALTGLTGSDEIPVWDAEASGEPTKKITAQDFAAAIKTLASLLGTGDVVNDLTSTATDKPGSANMLKTLNEKIETLVTTVNVANLGSYTGASLVNETASSGTKIKIISATGGNKISDLPVTDAGTYIVMPNTYYINIIFFGINGNIIWFNKESNQWITHS